MGGGIFSERLPRNWRRAGTRWACGDDGSSHRGCQDSTTSYAQAAPARLATSELPN
jgi:hypothetical protein